MEVGDKVIINNEALRFHGHTGTVADFENLQLRDDNSLILVNLGRNVYEWFFGRELQIYKK